MTITVSINSCADCRHLDHSGAFTEGGTQMICGHSDATRAPYAPGAGEPDPYHWKHRVINKADPIVSVRGAPIPYWCPLEHGAEY